MMRVNCRDGPQAIWRGEFPRASEGFPAHGLDPHLNHTIRSFHGAAHTARMVGIEGHGLFLIDVFACLNGGNEVEGMLVLGGRDEHGIDGLVVEQTAKVGVGLNARSDALHFVQAA